MTQPEPADAVEKFIAEVKWRFATTTLNSWGTVTGIVTVGSQNGQIPANGGQHESRIY